MTFFDDPDIMENVIMNKTKFFTIALSALLIYSCGKEDNESGPNLNNLESRASSCLNVQGLTGLYWDFANALPTGLDQPALIQNPGQQFVHSQLPLLGFTMPQGFSAFEITDPQTAAIGVNVLRNDNAVVFRWIPNSFVLNQIPSQTIIANEINNMFSHFQFNGTPEVLCSQFKQQVFEGIPMEFNARLLRFGNVTGQVWVITTYVAGGTAMAISVTAAPSQEYENQVMSTFLPINYQLYVDDRGNIVDKDNDGFTLLEDPDDNDPNVPVPRG